MAANADGLDADGFDAEDRALITRLSSDELGQAHIFAAWPKAGEDSDQKRACLQQLRGLDASYPGGLAAYVTSARRLLAQSQRGENPLRSAHGLKLPHCHHRC